MSFQNIIIVVSHNCTIKVMIGMNCYFRSPFHIWRLLPEEGNRTSHLHI
jgi:hypothetical protein